MKFEESVLAKNNSETYPSLDSRQEGALCLYDPITQLCKRIEAFFKKDSDIQCSFAVNNSHGLGPKIDPDTGEQMTRLMDIDGEPTEVLLEEDHISEFRIFCKDYEKAENLSNVVRHRHVFPEVFLGVSDERFHLREHYLIVRVYVLNAVDPLGPGAGSDPWSADDNTDSGLQEIFGLEPVDWNDVEGGCNPRLAPSDTSESDIPKGFPEEWEQQQWEAVSGSPACAWKWRWLKGALKGNKNVLDTSLEFNDGMNVWRFIECNFLPVVFQEDNLLSARGFNSILPADLFNMVFAVFNKFQVATYARKED